MVIYDKILEEDPVNVTAHKRKVITPFLSKVDGMVPDPNGVNLCRVSEDAPPRRRPPHKCRSQTINMC